MKTPIQLAVATLITLAVLVVLVYPWTWGMPARSLAYSPLSALLAAALTVLLMLLHGVRRAVATVDVPVHAEPLRERLALICTRLC